MRARFYNPIVGRFIQEDVYRGDGLNLYAYCGNNPVVYYNPSGYNTFNEWQKINPGNTSDPEYIKKYYEENPKITDITAIDPKAGELRIFKYSDPSKRPSYAAGQIQTVWENGKPEKIPENIEGVYDEKNETWV